MSKRRETLNSQSRELVVKLFNYFERESVNGGPLLPLTRPRERAAQALGIGKRTVTQILKEKYGPTGMEDNTLRTPNRKRKKKIVGVDNSDAAAIRNNIYTGPTSTMWVPHASEPLPSIQGRRLQGNPGYWWVRALTSKQQTEQADPPIETLKVDFEVEHEDHSEAVKDIVPQDEFLPSLYGSSTAVQPVTMSPTLVTEKPEPPDVDNHSTYLSSTTVQPVPIFPTIVTVKSEPPEDLQLQSTDQSSTSVQPGPALQTTVTVKSESPDEDLQLQPTDQSSTSVQPVPIFPTIVPVKSEPPEDLQLQSTDQSESSSHSNLTPSTPRGKALQILTVHSR